MIAKKHFPEVTIARGLTMLLVIIGHAFPDGNRYMRRPPAKIIHHIIYTFHMGVFMFLAGFVAAPRILSSEPVLPEVRKRFSRLMVPYFCWTALLIVLKQIFGALARDPFPLSDVWKLIIGAEHLGWLWYLQTLFLISALFLLLSRVIKKPCLLLAAGLLLHVIWFFHPNLYLDRVFKYAVFFMLGVCARVGYERLLPLLRSPVLTLISIAILACKPLIGAPYLVTGCAGIVLIWQLATLIARHPGKIYDFWTDVGNRSLDIFLVGYYVQVPARVIMSKFLHVPYWPQVIVCAVLGMILPLLLSRYLVPRLGPLRKIFFGHVK